MKVEMMKLSDYVTTTTPIFSKTIKDRLKIKNVLVFPNAVNEQESQFQPKPTKSDKVRFGWLGGSSHLHDIDLMTDIEGYPVLLEVNPRMSGSVSAAHIAGYPVVALAIANMLGIAYPFKLPTENKEIKVFTKCVVV
jgi:biotin carboxylase